MSRPPEVVAVIGPTATGKSDLGVALALALGGEVVNADASQLYKGMDIGTAKLTADERRGVRHHQLDTLAITDESTIAAYQTAARADLEGILARDRTPVLVGGSGLYVRSVVDRLEIPPTDPAVRARLEAELEAIGGEELHARLLARDPAAADVIERRNTRRVVRALEVIELTGRPYSATMPQRQFLRPTVLIGLRTDRDILDERIALRARRMWERGLLDEVRSLETQGLRRGRTASRAIGYAQAIAQLDGILGQEEAIAETTQSTRRLVRRQESYFRPDHRIVWLEATGPDLLDRALAVVSAGVADNG